MKLILCTYYSWTDTVKKWQTYNIVDTFWLTEDEVWIFTLENGEKHYFPADVCVNLLL